MNKTTIKGKLPLLVFDHAYQASGGMASVARLIIRTVLENQNENDESIVYCYKEYETFPIDRLGYSFRGNLDYKVF